MSRFDTHNLEKKSLKERFLLVIGIFFFIVYLSMGLAVLFWNEFAQNPLPLADNFRIALGVVLIVYAFLRFLRFFQKS